MQRNPEDLNKLRCSFCGRSHQEGMKMLITSDLKEEGKDGLTAAAVCDECSMNLMFTFTRMKELRVIATEQSNKAVETVGKVDKDGNCNCRNCTYERLMGTDHILNAIEEEQNALRSGHAGMVLN